MRSVKFLFAVCLALAFGNFCAGAEAEKVSGKRLTAQLIVGKIQEGFKSLSVEQKEFSDKMRDNSGGQFTEPEKSWSDLRDEKKSKWQADYKKEVGALLDKIDADKPESKKSWFTDEDRERFLSPPKEAIEQSLDKSFGQTYDPKATSAFNSARTEVVKEQQDKFIFNVHPTEEEFETMPRAELEKELYNRLLGKQQGLSLFAENRKAIGGPEVVGKIIIDAQTQRDNQKKIVEQSDGGQKVCADEIETFINDKLKEYRDVVTKEKANEKIVSKAYEVFPSVKKAIPAQANALAVKKFSDAISNFRSHANPEVLKEWMKQNIGRHITRVKSWELCLKDYRPEVQKEVIDWHAKGVEAGKKKEFCEFLEKLAESDLLCKKGIDKAVEDSLSKDFDKIRDEIAEEQLKEFFGPLAEKSWAPSAEQIERRDSQLGIDTTDPLKLPGISSKEFDEGKLIDETREKVNQSEEALFKEGISALKQQKNIVAGIESKILVMIPNNPKITSEDDVKTKYFELVKEAWALKPLAKKYSALFYSVEKMIEKNSAVLWRTDRLRQEKEKEAKEKEKEEMENKKKPVPEKEEKQSSGGEEKGKGKTGGGAEDNSKNGTGGEGNKEGGGPGEGGPGMGDGGVPDGGAYEMPDLIIDFDYNNGKIETRMIMPKEKMSINNIFSAEDYENPESFFSKMELVQQFFEKWFRENIKGETKVSFFVIARIFDGRVVYGSVNSFRKCIEMALKKIDSKNIEVFWFDDYFKKEHKGKKVVPKELISKGGPLKV